MLHHFLAYHSFGESCLHLHADNCSGQNKNRFMMAYLMWRVMVGLNREINMSFLLVGHTKFSPDWCFGFKRLYKRTRVSCLDDIADVATKSASVNHPQLVQLFHSMTGAITLKNTRSKLLLKALHKCSVFGLMLHFLVMYLLRKAMMARNVRLSW